MDSIKNIDLIIKDLNELSESKIISLTVVNKPDINNSFRVLGYYKEENLIGYYFDIDIKRKIKYNYHKYHICGFYNNSKKYIITIFTQNYEFNGYTDKSIGFIEINESNDFKKMTHKINLTKLVATGNESPIINFNPTEDYDHLSYNCTFFNYSYLENDLYPNGDAYVHENLFIEIK